MSKNCDCQIYEHCSICDPGYFKTFSDSKPKMSINTSQLNETIEMFDNRIIQGDKPSVAVLRLLIAAKRSKELEQRLEELTRDLDTLSTFHRHSPVWEQMKISKHLAEAKLALGKK